jgi:hypothetical protein
MTACIIQFSIPCRSPFAVHVTREESAWLVLVGENGWAHGDRAAALRDARWLSKNLALPIQDISNANS